jgi:hypothetical protein
VIAVFADRASRLGFLARCRARIGHVARRCETPLRTAAEFFYPVLGARVFLKKEHTVDAFTNLGAEFMRPHPAIDAYLRDLERIRSSVEPIARAIEAFPDLGTITAFPDLRRCMTPLVETRDALASLTAGITAGLLTTTTKDA